MRSIASVNNAIIFGHQAYANLNKYLEKEKPSLIFILVDENTQKDCLPIFLQQLATDISIEIIEIEAGEEHKTIATCEGVWETLSDLNADRKSLLINLGGGVVTDLGGFVASTFKRGIAYVNIPTSLLAMVDASVGGKTGVDLGNLKNQIGVISNPEMVLIDTTFLASLPQNQLRSGLSEMLKHGLISSRNYWNKMTDLSQFTAEDLEQLIYESVEIKNEIVKKDLRENSLRKTLNFGHTLGHAVESYFLTHLAKTTLLHGEAIAIGMIMAAFISSEMTDLPTTDRDEIKKVLEKTFSKTTFEKKDIPAILDLLKFDKKNSHGRINFVLLQAIGKPVIDCQVSNELILASFDYYAKKL